MAIWRKKWESDCMFPSQDWKKQFVEKNLVLVSDVVLIYLYENMWPGFFGWSLCWSTELLDLQLHHSQILLGAGKKRKWLFAQVAWKLRIHHSVLISKSRRLFMVPNFLRIVVHEIGSFVIEFEKSSLQSLWTAKGSIRLPVGHFAEW